jgi:ubiquinone/menaquinone biosynthesis C-methylase UbiE
MVGESVPKIDVGGFDGVDGSHAPDEFAAWMTHQRARTGDRLFAALDVGVDDAVLDIGCGTGVDLDAVAGLTARATGIDLSETMARTARDRGDGGKCTFAVADGQHLPFPAGSFDAVCLRAVLVHTPRPELTIAELSRVLRPGGRAVLSEPDHGSHVVATSEQEVLDRLLHTDVAGSATR